VGPFPLNKAPAHYKETPLPPLAKGPKGATE